MMHLLNLEEIESLLLKVPLLIKQFDERDPGFFHLVKSWLADVEDMLSKNRLPQTSEISVCRSTLISIERGFSDGIEIQSRMNARKLRDAQASHVLKRATDVLMETIRFRRGQVDEAIRVMMQIVAVADHLGLIASDSGQNHTTYLQSTLLTISNQSELTSLVVHITGLLGKTDTLVVLDRAITSIRQ